MSDPIQIDVTYDGGNEKIYAEKISDNIYKCLESSFFIDFINYGCEIEVEEDDGKLKFLWLYKESPYVTKRYILNRAFVESQKLEGFKKEVMGLNGYWEMAMGGVLIFHIPIEKKELIDSLLAMLNVE